MRQQSLLSPLTRMLSRAAFVALCIGSTSWLLLRLSCFYAVSVLVTVSSPQTFDSATIAGVSALLAHGVRASSAKRPHALVLHAFGFSPRLPSLLQTVAACLGGDAVMSGEGDTAAGGVSSFCPTKPFLPVHFIKATWEWMEVAARVAAANRTPAQQANDALGQFISSPCFDPKQVLEGVESLKALYIKETGTTDDSQWLRKLYEDVVEWGRGIWKEVHVEGLIQVCS